MKRIAMILLALVLLTGLLPASLAEGGRLNPPNLPAMPGGPYARPAGMVPRSSGRLETVVAPELGETGVWQAPEGSQYLFRLWLLDEEAYTYYAILDQHSLTDNTFSYTIREPGEYMLDCYISVSETSISRFDTLYFTVEDKAGVDCVASRVKDIVAQCRASVSGDYETALWLHDWIIEHAYYDLTYDYHGADSILYYGKGVCDSYSKLYQLMLQEAGLSTIRLSGTGNGGGHAWNLVKIDGKWCHVDATWDDPADGTEAGISGYETHDYFGLNDALMALDHGFESSIACTTLDNYYIKREGTYKLWIDHIWSSLEQAFLSGMTTFDVNTRGRIMAGNGWYYSDPNYVNQHMTIVNAIMSEEDWRFKGGRTVRAAFTYDTEQYILHYDLTVDGVDLVLPDSLTVIGESAFENGAAIYGIRLPESAERIEARAFSGCGALTWVVIPADSVAIDSAAFDGVPEGFIIVCNPDSSASAFASSKGIAQMPLE